MATTWRPNSPSRSILRRPAAREQRVAPVHLGAEVLEHLDGAVHVGPDEVLGRLAPRGQLDLLAVHEGQADRRGPGRPRR